MKLKHLLAMAVMTVIGCGSALGAVITETYDFQNFTSTSTPDISLSETAVEQSGTNAQTVYVMNDPSQNFKLKGRFALNCTNKTAVQMRWMWRNGSNAWQYGLCGNWNGKGTAVNSYNLSILNLKANDKVQITYTIRSGKTAQPHFCSGNIVSTTEDGTNVVAAEATVVSGQAYYMLNDGNLDLYVTNDNMGITKIVIVTEGDEELIESAPSMSVTGGNDSQRIVTIADQKTNTDNNTVTYYTKDGSTPTASSILYKDGIIITPADLNENNQVIIKAISYKEGDTNIKSAESQLTVGIPVGYSAIKTIDFTTLIDGQGANGEVSATFGSNTLQQYLGDNVNVLDEDFYVQMVEGNNRFYCHNGGLYAYYGGGRRVGLTNLKAGQIVKIFVGAETPGQEVNSVSAAYYNYDKNYYFNVTEDGNTSFAIPRYTVIKSIEVLSAPTGEVVGAINMSTPENGAYSSDITLVKGETKTITFQNHGTTFGNNWRIRVKEGETVKSVTRADSWDETAGAATKVAYTQSVDGGATKGAINWETYAAAMADAECVAVLAYGNDNVLSITTTSQNGQYISYVDQDVTMSGADATINLSVCLSWLEVKDVKTTAIARTTATDKFGTICAPFAASVEGATVYSASINAEKTAVVLEEVSAMEAGKPYIYKATADAQTFSYASGDLVSEPVANGPLTGALAATEVPVGSYVMQTQSGVQAFYVVVDGKQPTLSPYKAYLTVPESAGAKMISFGEDSDATAIKALDAITSGKAKIYDLNGRELKSLQKGVNIVNGVKVVVK